MNKINVYGSSGFIGNRFSQLNSECINKIDRNDYSIYEEKYYI